MDEIHIYELSRVLLKDDSFNIKDEIENLRIVINYADRKYYIDSEPVLTDFEYDNLFKKLLHLEKRNPQYITQDSPTQRVAQALTERFPAVNHLVPMLSLDNTYNKEDLLEWYNRCLAFVNEGMVEFCVEPKYDGASISLVYENDKLKRGVTRGDGIMGEEITTNIRQIKSIPLSASFNENGIHQIEIRGEVVILKDTFEAYNKIRVAGGEPPLANPRNAASGTLRMLDPNEVKKRGLSAILYHVSYINLQDNLKVPFKLETHYGSLNLLNNLGFPTPYKEMQVFNKIEDVIDYCIEFEKRRETLPFEIDGLVIKINNLAMQEKMGMTSHHPRWAVAYKFKAKQATSKLIKVEFQVGRTGNISPVAKIEPVPISGVTVASVSLFNEDVIKEKDIRLGDIVVVERAGDVIPYIVRPLTELRTGEETPILFPGNCPECGSKLEKQPDIAAWYCVNLNCPAQIVEKIIHFASKNAMDIRNFGSSNIQKFYDLGLLKDISDIYHLDWEIIKNLDGLGEKSINNLKVAITNSKTQSLNRLIFGLGIRYVGETTAKTLASSIANITELYNWDIEKLLTLEDVGPKVANSVFSFFNHIENRKLISKLSDAGLNLNNETKMDVSDKKLSGKTFLFTGTLEALKRNVAEEMVEKLGGKLLNTVSSKLNYLIVGEDAGSKLEKAKKLGSINILNETEFLELVAES